MTTSIPHVIPSLGSPPSPLETTAVDFAFARPLAEGGGLLGTPALWKHLGKKTAGWGPQGETAGVPWVEVGATPAPLRVDLVGDERTLMIIAAGAGSARALTVQWDGRPLGTATLAEGVWQAATFPIDPALATEGSHRIGLRFAGAKAKVLVAPGSVEPMPRPGKKAAALLGSFHLLRAITPAVTASASPAPHPDDAGVRLLASERASWFLPVPAGAKLSVEGGAGAFRVTAVADGRAPIVLHDGDAAAGVSASLEPLAGEVVRIDFEAPVDGPALVRKPRIVVPATAASVEAAAKPPKHLILVIIDSLPAKVLRFLNPGARAETPTLDAIAREGTSFAEFTASGVYSKPTGASIWTGLYPDVHHGHDPKSRLPKSAIMVQEVFRKAGFRTCGLSANGYVSDPLGYKRGWDKWYHYLIYDSGPFRGEKLYRDANAWVDERLAAEPDARLFMMLFPTDPHLPYRPPKELAEKYYGRPYEGTLNPNNTGLLAERMKDGKYKLKPADWEYYVALYLGDVEYSDIWLGSLVAHLRARGIYDDTLLMITADHGEEFLEHGSVGHGHALWDEIIHVPLLVRHPGTVPAGRVVRSPADQADLAPTLLAAAGLPPEPTFQGASLWAWARGAPPIVPVPGFSQFTSIASAVRTGRWKLIKFHTRDKKEYLYDLAADPGETKNLAAERPIALRYAWNLLSHWEAVEKTYRKSEGAIGAMVK